MACACCSGVISLIHADVTCQFSEFSCALCEIDGALKIISVNAKAVVFFLLNFGIFVEVVC